MQVVKSKPKDYKLQAILPAFKGFMSTLAVVPASHKQYLFSFLP